jgi:hypothetical protein
MQINSKHYNSDFHHQLIDAAKICDVNRIVQLIFLEINTLELDQITQMLLSSIDNLQKPKSSSVSVAEELKRRRKLKEGGSA